ncbi:MAG: Nre family DNA repair protein [Thermoprotei archaeon]|nr:Nre family DNA repair protein [Thermoprotei archaeon]
MYGSVIGPRLCVLCRGRGLCGLTYCPLIVRSMTYLRLAPLKSSNVIEGSSPPSVFVGRAGYPHVRAGPAAPPEVGDTSVFDLPEAWLGRSLEEILNYRLSMVLGLGSASVKRVDDRLVGELRLLALSSKPVDVRIEFLKPPRPKLSLSEELPPMGPRSPLERLSVVGNPHVPGVVDRVYGDRDLRARDAILKLYESGIPVSHIQRLLSVGALGTGKFRRLVPTRWSITAVDSTIARSLVSKIKGYRVIDSVEVYVWRGYDNTIIAILYPRKWSFEWMEAWWPGSTWNPGSLEVVVEGDYEGYSGRADYPSIGGCYYASMLATVEHLEARKRQATAILMREIYPGFNIPVGVWFVREAARAMFRKGPLLKTGDMGEVGEVVERESRLGWGVWLSRSKLLRRVVGERGLDFTFK